MTTYKLAPNPETGAKRELRIVQDTDPCNPRTEDDCHLGQMVCWHRSYDLGDKHDFGAPDDLKKALNEEAAVRLPLYLYDHSGITMNTTGFDCLWDSGQVGEIWVSKKKLIEAYGKDNEATRATAKACLISEVETYDQYLAGDVYGFELVEVRIKYEMSTEALMTFIKENRSNFDTLSPEQMRGLIDENFDSEDDDEVVDSCWGFYGNDIEDNGILDHLDSEDRVMVLTQT